jgi:hypothetical protein
MMFAAYCAEALRLGADGWRFGLGLLVRRLLHDQKPMAPSSAIRITPTIATLITQRIASLAIRKKMSSKIMPAITKMVVELI